LNKQSDGHLQKYRVKYRLLGRGPIAAATFDLAQSRGAETFYFMDRGCAGVIVMKMSTTLGVVIATTMLCSAPVSIDWSPINVAFKSPSLSVDTAQARVGRPLTPMSVAGVNRRVNRRAYYGAAAGAAAAGAAGYGYYNYYRQPACGYYPYGPC